MLSDGGMGLTPENTRNQPSKLFSGNVRKLEVALTHVAPNYIGKRGAVAVTTLLFAALRAVPPLPK